MEQIFLRLVSMSLSAGWLVLAVVLLRQALKRAPRRIVCLLWALVALRLVCPVQIVWRASLVPSRETIASAQETVATAAQTASAASAGEADAAETALPDPEQTPDLVFAASRVWLAGAAAMLLWAAISDVRLRLRLRGSVRQEGNIRLCGNISTSFVLGVFLPRIYLPTGLQPEQRSYVLAHERAHIARLDHVWKPLGWVLLSVYWFHPLLWLAYVLVSRDLELACDERVARSLDRSGLAAYAETLLDCSCRRTALIAPVGFGAVSVKSRVKAVLRYRKPVFRQTALALLTVAVAGAFFLTERPAAMAQLSEALAAVPADSVGLHPEDYPPESKTSHAPQPAPAPAQDAASATVSQPQSSARTAEGRAVSSAVTETETQEAPAVTVSEPQTVESTGTASTATTVVKGMRLQETPTETTDAYIREENARQAQKNQEVAAKARSTQVTSTQETYGPQPAVNVQPGTPVVLAAGNPNSPTTPNTGIVQNGDAIAIRLYP